MIEVRVFKKNSNVKAGAFIMEKKGSDVRILLPDGTWKENPDVPSCFPIYPEYMHDLVEDQR